MENSTARVVRFARFAMRRSFFCFSLLALGAAFAHGVAQEKTPSAKGTSAFDAVRLLNAQQQAALAIIAGRDGSPEPERWHLLTHEPAGEAGLREYVVTKGKIVTSHGVSQFAETLGPESVFAPESLKLDSDRVIRLARDFARANRVTVATMHFDLRRGGADRAALWTAICLDARGEELGRLVLNASDSGTVISHAGFAVAPTSEQAVPAPVSLVERRTKPKPPPVNTARRRTSGPPPFAAAPQPQPPAPPPRTGFFERVFGGSR